MKSLSVTTFLLVFFFSNISNARMCDDEKNDYESTHAEEQKAHDEGVQVKNQKINLEEQLETVSQEYFEELGKYYRAAELTIEARKKYGNCLSEE